MRHSTCILKEALNVFKSSYSCGVFLQHFVQGSSLQKSISSTPKKQLIPLGDTAFELPGTFLSLLNSIPHA